MMNSRALLKTERLSHVGLKAVASWGGDFAQDTRPGPLKFKTQW